MGPQWGLSWVESGRLAITDLCLAQRGRHKSFQHCAARVDNMETGKFVHAFRQARGEMRDVVRS